MTPDSRTKRLVEAVITGDVRAWKQLCPVLQAGDNWAWNCLWGELIPRMRAWAAIRLSDTGIDLEDVLQNVWEELFRVLARDGLPNALIPALRNLVDRRCIDAVRGMHRELRTPNGNPELDNMADRRSAAVEERVQVEDLQEQLMCALNKLTNDDREVLTLRYLEDLTNTEIAKRLRITTNNVGARLFRARQRMHGILFSEAACSPTRPP
jgi:RNA polymerase sigma-70 factor (ECF subfamily)